MDTHYDRRTLLRGRIRMLSMALNGRHGKLGARTEQHVVNDLELYSKLADLRRELANLETEHHARVTKTASDA